MKKLLLSLLFALTASAASAAVSYNGSTLTVQTPSFSFNNTGSSHTVLVAVIYTHGVNIGQLGEISYGGQPMQQSVADGTTTHSVYYFSLTSAATGSNTFSASFISTPSKYKIYLASYDGVSVIGTTSSNAPNPNISPVFGGGSASTSLNVYFAGAEGTAPTLTNTALTVRQSNSTGAVVYTFGDTTQTAAQTFTCTDAVSFSAMGAMVELQAFANTPTITPTATPTATKTFTLTASPTATPTFTKTQTLSSTITTTSTPTASPSATKTITATSSPTATPSASPTISATASPTVTLTTVAIRYNSFYDHVTIDNQLTPAPFNVGAYSYLSSTGASSGFVASDLSLTANQSISFTVDTKNLAWLSIYLECAITATAQASLYITALGADANGNSVIPAGNDLTTTVKAYGFVLTPQLAGLSPVNAIYLFNVMNRFQTSTNSLAVQMRKASDMTLVSGGNTGFPAIGFPFPKTNIYISHIGGIASEPPTLSEYIQNMRIYELTY